METVDFVTGVTPVKELIVTGPKSPPIATLEDLSGKTLHVRKTTSYYESVLALKRSPGEGRQEAGQTSRRFPTRWKTRTSSRC
jgi:ABC-type amino acid transport substrate-binding protein